jgi:hypothetical protein
VVVGVRVDVCDGRGVIVDDGGTRVLVGVRVGDLVRVGVAVAVLVAVTVRVAAGVGVVVDVGVTVAVAARVTVKEGVAVEGITGWTSTAGVGVLVAVTVAVGVMVGEVVGVGESVLAAVAVAGGGAGVALGKDSGWRGMSSTWGTEETIRVVPASASTWACWAPATSIGGGRAMGPLTPTMFTWLRMLPSTGSTIRISAGWSVTTISLPSSVMASESGCAGRG